MDNQFKESDDYGPCDSPKAKKIFINMLDQIHSPSASSKQQQQSKMKSSMEGKPMNISSPSSYNSSSPSSTSSLSSTSNVQHQKNAMTGQTMNGSSEYISKIFIDLMKEFELFKILRIFQQKKI